MSHQERSVKNRFLRQWIMLQQIPRCPIKTTTRYLKEILAEKGFEVTQRTIQRDLKTLLAVLPGLQVDDEKDFPGWFWSRDARLLDLPAMDANMALTFQLADHFLKTMFPPAILDRLEPYFDTADGVLKTVNIPGYASWTEKIRILPRTLPLIPATIQEDVVAVIYEALFKGKQLRGRYVKRHGDEVEYDLHPLGLIFRESVSYLVATIWDYKDPRHLALHRFRHCVLLEDDVEVPDGFDLDKYLAAGSFAYGEKDGEMIRLKVIFFDGVGRHLLETPLNNDQEVSEEGEGRLQVVATVQNSAQLRWWLLGFGDYVEVVEPRSLREEFIETVRNLTEIYSRQ